MVLIRGQVTGIDVISARLSTTFCPIGLACARGQFPPCHLRAGLLVAPIPTGFGDAVKGDAPSADSFSISVDQFGGFSVSEEGSAVALDAGATATLASFNWLQNGNALLKKNGSPATEAHPAKTKFNFGIIRMGGLALLGMPRRELRVVKLSPPRLW